MRLIFFGTPDFAVPALETLARDHEIAAVIAQPDRPAGRGLALRAPPVAEKARELNLHVLQPSRLRDDSFLDELRRIEPEIGIVIAYGRILPTSLLEIPPQGFLNIHASLLPKYRGAAPIQRAIAAGDRSTGVTIMRVDAELDHGPILAIEELAIGEQERAPALLRRLAASGASLMSEVLEKLKDGSVEERPQDHESATHAPKIEKHEGEVTWNETTRSIYDRFRAFDPWPGVFSNIGGETIKLVDLRPEEVSGPARTIVSIDSESVVVATGDGAVRLVSLQRPGKTRASAPEVARALHWEAGKPLP